MLRRVNILRGVLQSNGGKRRSRVRRRRRRRSRGLPFLLGWTFGQKLVFTSTAITTVSFPSASVKAIFFLRPLRRFGLLPIATFGGAQAVQRGAQATKVSNSEWATMDVNGKLVPTMVGLLKG